MGNGWRGPEGRCGIGREEEGSRKVRREGRGE